MDEETQEVVRSEGSVPALPEIEELAVQVIQVMDKIAERMALESPHPSTRKRVRGARTVPREFVVALTAAFETVPQMRVFQTFDPVETRDVLQEGDAYRGVVERTNRLLASMKYTIEARWAKVAEAAMLTFTLASIRAKEPGNGELAAVVENLGKLLRRRGKKKKKQE